MFTGGNKTNGAHVNKERDLVKGKEGKWGGGCIKSTITKFKAQN